MKLKKRTRLTRIQFERQFPNAETSLGPSWEVPGQPAKIAKIGAVSYCAKTWGGVGGKGAGMSDDLTIITGIGPTRAAVLAAHNIDTFRALALADADFLVKTMEVTPTMIIGWQMAASDLWKDQMDAEMDAAGPEAQAVYEHLLTGKVKR